MLRRAGLPVAALDHPDYQIPADRVQALLADCANSAASEDFGLLVGKAFRLSMKGPLGLLMREQPTVRVVARGPAALSPLPERQRRDSRRAAGRRPGGRARLISPRTIVSRQMVDMTLAMYVQIFRGLLGERLAARSARSSPAPRRRTRRLRDLLGMRLEFGAPSTRLPDDPGGPGDPALPEADP